MVKSLSGLAQCTMHLAALEVNDEKAAVARLEAAKRAASGTSTGAVAAAVLSPSPPAGPGSPGAATAASMHVDAETDPAAASAAIAVATAEAEVVGRARIVQSMVPAMYPLTSDASIHVRTAMVPAVTTMLQVLSKQHSACLLPMLAQLLEDGSQEVGCVGVWVSERD